MSKCTEISFLSCIVLALISNVIPIPAKCKAKTKTHNRFHKIYIVKTLSIKILFNGQESTTIYTYT